MLFRNILRIIKLELHSIKKKHRQFTIRLPINRTSSSPNYISLGFLVLCQRLILHHKCNQKLIWHKTGLSTITAKNREPNLDILAISQPKSMNCCLSKLRLLHSLPWKQHQNTLHFSSNGWNITFDSHN